MTEKEKLEIEVQTCRHLKIDIDRKKEEIFNEFGRTFSHITFDREEKRHINVNQIHSEIEDDFICELTNKPCVLYNQRDTKIDFKYSERCPAFEKTSKKYVLKIKEGNNENSFHLHRMEEEK